MIELMLEANSMSTIILKLYKPSLRKRIIIDEAMENYSKAFQYLLDKAENEIDIIKEKYVSVTGACRASYLTKWIDGDLLKELNKFSIEPFKDSIKIDFAATLAGYFNLKYKDNSVKYPSAYITNEVLEKEYDGIMEDGADYKSTYILEDKINKIISKSYKHRALFFCRYSTIRNYSLLYNCENDRYYAKIYLMNVKDEKRKKLGANSCKTLFYISKNKEKFIEALNKKCFILFPLSFGKYQEQFLKVAISNPKTIKTARLTKYKNEYFLHINISKERPQPVKIINYMGVSRGIENALNCAIVDSTGNPICTSFEKKEKNEIYLNKIHEMANSIVNLARENQCQVIMERLVDKGDGLIWKDKQGVSYFPIVNMRKYNKLCFILNYKLPDNGLPPLIKVSGVNIFYTCPSCGVNSKENRFSSEILICTNCGKTVDIEKSGCFNLARKLIKYKNDKIKINTENSRFGLKLTNKDLDFEYYPENPFDCAEEFKGKMNIIAKNFNDNINIESKKANFKKKLSFIRKIEACKDIFEIIEIN